ncbi:MAG TPA: polysaccharide biosynthesis tyrosine autokinase [Vicinamibacterales bacterium]|nr:polysaccharide biosynthesis tyrosine autokinase [Vicinamibacterales bacterium]
MNDQFPNGGAARSVPMSMDVSHADADGGRRDNHSYFVGPTKAAVHLLDYVKVVHKQRWLATTVFAVIVLSVAAYTFTATPIYQATVKILIESVNPNVVSFSEVIKETQDRADYYQTQYNILQSRSLARKTLDQLQLWGYPEFHAPPRAASTWQDWLPAALRGKAPAPAPPPPVVTPGSEAETAAESSAIDAFISRLEVAPVRNSRIVDVNFSSSSPEMAERVANAHARNYIDQTLEFRFMASKEASDWLGQRLAEQRRQVETAEIALQRYREEHGAISLTGRENIVVQQMGELNTNLTRARTERIEKEALYRQIEAIQNDRAALDTFPAIQTNAFVQQLKAELLRLQRELADKSDTLGDRHPEIIRLRSAIQVADTRLQGEIAKVVQSVRNDYRAAQAQETSLAAAVDQQKHEALAMNRAAIEFAVLERDAQSSRLVYDSLLQRSKETGVSTELRTSNIRIVDKAERPRSAISPRRRLNMTLAVFGGGVLAIGLAFFVDYLDDRIKTPDVIKSKLGLPFLGLIPLVSDKYLPDQLLLSNGVPTNFGEAFRTLRTNVLFSTAAEGARSLMITSTGPGEGKTVIAANLAIALAQAGHRVLLIDADMRRSRLHHQFGLTEEPGLSNLMIGGTKASDAVRKSSVQGLWVLPAGYVPPNPAELLASQRFRDFLTTLNDHFDWIVIDAPPVMPVADASTIAHSVTAVVFVVGAEMPSVHAAAKAVEQLDNVRAKFAGAVLNRVDLQRQAYYYSHYYRHEYSRYYARG